MPNLENIRKWVDALRSGEYYQGRDQLRSRQDTYCCLGVACEVAMRNNVELEVTYYDYEYRYNNERYGLPCPVLDWLGLDVRDNNPVVGTDTDETTIRAMNANDDLGLSFAEIAVLLERRYLSK